MYGKIAMELGKTQEALKLLQEGKDIYQGLADANPQHSADQETLTWNMKLLVSCNEQIAKSYIDKKQFEIALEFCQKAEKLMQSLADRNPKDAQTQRDLAAIFAVHAYLLDQLGQTEETLGISQQGLAIVHRVAEADPNNTEDREVIEWYRRLIARCYEQLAQSHFDAKQFDKALDFNQRAEGVWRSQVERAPKDASWQRNLASSCGKQGVVLMELNRTEKAQESFQQGLDIYQRLVETDPNNTADKESLAWYIEQLEAAKQKK